jgi:hypothetical protein
MTVSGASDQVVQKVRGQWGRQGFKSNSFQGTVQYTSTRTEMFTLVDASAQYKYGHCCPPIIVTSTVGLQCSMVL